MNADEIRSLLEEVFFEEEYEIGEQEYERRGQPLMRLYVKHYSERLKRHMPMIGIENNAIVDDVWQMTWALATQKYSMKIPNANARTFLMLAKEKLKDILTINRMSEKLLSDMREMDKNPDAILRDFKLNRLL